MNTRRINQTLWWLSALLAAAAAIVLIVGFALPLESRSGTGSGGPDMTAASSANALPALASLEPIWDLRLRGELGAPATAPAAQLAAARGVSDEVPVSLAGTIGQSLAMLRDQGGQIAVKAVGESVNGVEVLDVRPARVDVRYNGKVVTLQKPPDTQPGT